MKTAITPAYTFNPAAGTLNLSGISGFNADLLYEVINLSTGQAIYDAGIQELGYAALSGTTLTLRALAAGVLSGMSAGDNLQILYEVPVSGGSGGGGAVTAAAGAFVDGSIATIGTEADAAYVPPGSGPGSGTLGGAAEVPWRPAGGRAEGNTARTPEPHHDASCGPGRREHACDRRQPDPQVDPAAQHRHRLCDCEVVRGRGYRRHPAQRRRGNRVPPATRWCWARATRWRLPAPPGTRAAPRRSMTVPASASMSGM